MEVIRKSSSPVRLFNVRTYPSASCLLSPRSIRQMKNFRSLSRSPVTTSPGTGNATNESGPRREPKCNAESVVLSELARFRSVTYSGDYLSVNIWAGSGDRRGTWGSRKATQFVSGKSNLRTTGNSLRRDLSHSQGERLTSMVWRRSGCAMGPFGVRCGSGRTSGWFESAAKRGERACP